MMFSVSLQFNALEARLWLRYVSSPVCVHSDCGGRVLGKTCLLFPYRPRLSRCPVSSTSIRTHRIVLM